MRLRIVRLKGGHYQLERLFLRLFWIAVEPLRFRPEACEDDARWYVAMKRPSPPTKRKIIREWEVTP